MKNTRYRAQDILAVIGDMRQPVAWRDLVNEVAAITPKDITRLRQILRGLERNGELSKSVDGSYFIEQAQSSAVGRVQGRGRRMTVDSFEIADAQRLPLRAGDEVSYAVVAGEARVQEITEFNPEPVAGVVKGQGRTRYVDAIGALRARITLLEKTSAEQGDTVSVQVTGRERNGLVGRVVEVISGKYVLDEAISTALVAHQIPHIWPDAVTRAASQLPKSVQPNRFPQRRDLTAMPLVTIDGETAKDFDDAVYARKNKGGWQLVVAIADVAHYVKPDSALDAEAVQRGTSAYFPERVVPMLPEAISNGLCSLRPLTPRLSLVCEMQVSKQGLVVEHQFYEAVIYSHARLTYTEVQAYLDGKSQLTAAGEHESVVAASVKALEQVFKAFHKAREKRGALDFPTHEGALHIKRGRVASIAPVTRVQSNQLIEEAMIAANVCAAQFLEDCGLGGLYRVHEPPEQGRLEELRQALAYAGVRLPPGELAPAQLQAALEKLPSTANSWLFGQLALRTMQQAIYTPANRGHYGLALERYMHFTSPIRRYPDLVVHRLIKHQIAKQAKQQRSDTKKLPKIPSADEVQWLGEVCSNHERRAESAGWMVDGWLKCDYLLDRIGETFNGTIATVTDFGLFVELEGCFIQGLLHISNLGSDYYNFHARSQSLVGERNGRRFSMGDSIQVVIKHIEPAQGQIDLLLADNRGQGDAGNTKRGQGRKGQTRKADKSNDSARRSKTGKSAKAQKTDGPKRSDQPKRSDKPKNGKPKNDKPNNDKPKQGRSRSKTKKTKAAKRR